MKKTLVASYCGACGEVCLSYQEPEDGDGVGDLVNCPNCLTDIGGNAGGAWNEVDLPVEDQLRFEQLTRRAQPPFQRVVNHEPEYARRIAQLEEQIRKVHEQADKWTGNLHDVCMQLEERIKKVETEGVGYKAVVTRDPELQNQFTRLEKKLEPLQGWMNEVAEKFKKLEGWKADARLNMLEGEIGGAAEERAELAGRVTGVEKQLDLHQESLDGLYQDTAAWMHRLDQLANKLPMKGVAAATDHVNAVAQEIRKLNQRVEDLAKTPDLETELRTKLSQHVKQSDSGYEELDLRVSKLEERRPLFDEHVERCHDFEVDIRDRIQTLDDRLVDVEPNGEAIETLGAYLEEQLKGLRQDLADLECRAIRVGAVEEAHGALAAQFERLVAKLDQYPEITMEASAKAREVSSRVSKLETMMADHFLRRVQRDDVIEKTLTDRIDGVELRLVNVETTTAGLRKDLGRVEALAKRADEEEFAQGAVEGFTARFEEVDQQIKQLQETRASARQVSNLADRIIALEHKLCE